MMDARDFIAERGEMDDTQRLLIIAVAIGIGVFFWVRGRSLKSYLGDAEEAKSLGDIKGAAIAYELAGKKAAKTNLDDSAKFYDKAGGFWVEAQRPAAAVGAYRLSILAWEQGGNEKIEEFETIRDHLQDAEELLAAAGPSAMADEESLRSRNKNFNIARRIVLFGGVLSIYLATQSLGISYWWLLLPLAAHMAIYAYADKFK